MNVQVDIAQVVRELVVAAQAVSSHFRAKKARRLTLYRVYNQLTILFPRSNIIVTKNTERHQIAFNNLVNCKRYCEVTRNEDALDIYIFDSGTINRAHCGVCIRNRGYYTRKHFYHTQKTEANGILTFPQKIMAPQFDAEEADERLFSSTIDQAR